MGAELAAPSDGEGRLTDLQGQPGDPGLSTLITRLSDVQLEWRGPRLPKISVLS